MITKRGEKDESLSKPQAAQAPTIVPLNPNIETVKPVKTKRKSTHTERHEERKRQKLTAEEKRLGREAAMILEKQEHERQLADFKSKTKEITEAAKARTLKEVVEKSKKPSSSSTVEREREGRDKSTLRLIERIRKETEQEQKLQADVKQEPLTGEEKVTTSCGVPGFSMDIEKVIAIKAIPGTKRLLERLVFEMEDGKRQIWLVQTILTLDYITLVYVYNRKVHVKISKLVFN